MSIFFKYIERLPQTLWNFLKDLRSFPGNDKRISDIEKNVSKISSNLLFSRVARFLACEKISGDYIEFGVFRGDAFARFFHTLEEAFQIRIAQDMGGNKEEIDRQERMNIWNNMRFFAFDSFKGLPSLNEKDTSTGDFAPGQYSCDLECFKANIINLGVPLERVTPVKGWFEDTCNLKTAYEHQLEKAAVVFIDCDLYSSTKTVLEFIGDFLQDGTILIFDDWFSYRGNPARGEQKAFYEWASSEPIKSRFRFTEYQKDSWNRNSFIANEIIKGC